MTHRTVPVAALLAFAQRCVEFPFPKICKHFVAAELLGLLEQHGLPADDAFRTVMRDVVSAHDAEAIQGLSAPALREDTR